MLANLADRDGVASDTDSGNETISSENVEPAGGGPGGWPESLPAHPPEYAITEPPPRPELHLQDIDAFIASVRVPPPPSSAKSPDDLDLPPPPPSLVTDADKTPTAETASRPVSGANFPPPPDVVPHVDATQSRGARNGASVTSASTHAQWKPAEPEVPSPDNVSLEDEYASLVIPPPPSSSETEALGEIPIVPPVNVKTPSPPESTTVILRERDSKRSSLTVSEKEAAENKRQSLIDLEETGPSVAALAKTLQQSSVKQRSDESPGSSNKGTMSPSGEPLKARPRRSSEGKAKRPKVQPPPPPTRLNSYPGTSQSLPSSPPDDVTVSRVSPAAPAPSGQKRSPYVLLEGTVKPSHLLLWRPTETKSADNSPVHKPSTGLDEQLRGSTGTLTRNKKGMLPPAPPPRRSSIPVPQSPPSSSVPVSHAKSRSVDSTPSHSSVVVEEKYKALSNINYVNVFEAQSSAQNSAGPQSDATSSKLTKSRIPSSSSKTSVSNGTNAQASANKGVVNVDPNVNINMDKIKAELQRKLSGSDLLPSAVLKPRPAEDTRAPDGAETQETFNIEKVKEELQQKLNPSLYRKETNGTIPDSQQQNLPNIDQSNYVKPNSQNQTGSKSGMSSDEHYEIDMNKIKNELQQKLAPSSVKKPLVTEMPVLAGTVEIEKYKIKADQKATSSRYSYVDGNFDMNKVKAELQNRLTPGSVGSSPSRASPSRASPGGKASPGGRSYPSGRITKADIRHVSTGSLDSPTLTDSGVGDADVGVDGEISQITSYRSPLVSRRQFSFDFLRGLRETSGGATSETENAASDTSSDTGAVFGEYRVPSPQIGRSHSLSSSSQGRPSNTPSPKGSPLVARHSSFSKLAERVPSPLRSLFGGGERERTSSESDSYSSAPPSPRRIPSVANNASPLSKIVTRSGLSNGNTQVKVLV